MVVVVVVVVKGRCLVFQRVYWRMSQAHAVKRLGHLKLSLTMR